MLNIKTWLRTTATSSNNVLFFGRANLFIMFTIFFASDAITAAAVIRFFYSFFLSLSLSIFFVAHRSSLRICKISIILKSKNHQLSIHTSNNFHCLMIDFLCVDIIFVFFFTNKEKREREKTKTHSKKFRIVISMELWKKKNREKLRSQTSFAILEKKNRRKSTTMARPHFKYPSCFVCASVNTLYHFYQCEMWTFTSFVIVRIAFEIGVIIYIFSTTSYHHHHSFIVDVQQPNTHTHMRALISCVHTGHLSMRLFNAHRLFCFGIRSLPYPLSYPMM